MNKKLAVFALVAVIALAAFFMVDNARARRLCGDGSCSTSEDCLACPADCGTCPPEELFCGDGYCNSIRYDINLYSTDAEFLSGCVSDPNCLKGLNEKEDCFTCPVDCGACADERCPDGTPKSFWDAAVAQYENNTVEALKRAVSEAEASLTSFPTQHFSAPSPEVRKAAKVLYSLQQTVLSEISALRAWLKSCKPGVCLYYSECVLGAATAYNLVVGSAVEVASKLRPNMTNCMYNDTEGCLAELWPKANSSLAAIAAPGFGVLNISDSCPLFSDYDTLRQKLPRGLGDRMMLEQKLAMASGWRALYETVKFAYDSSMPPVTEQDQIARIVLAEQIIYLADHRESLAAAGC